jgi:aryl carrier-like protein
MKKKGAKAKAKASVQETVRICANIRSKKHPDVRCPLPATQGEFCARHAKNPTRFQEKFTLESNVSLVKVAAAATIQAWWNLRAPHLRIKRQGPATHLPSLAENQTDVYTLEPVDSIPLLYRWSYVDEKKHLWVFDIRSLSMMRGEDSRGELTNPYTREKFPPLAQTHFHERCTWLRTKKYCLVHTADAIEMTPEQVWHQRLLDVSMKYDMLGYHMCLNWFEELRTEQLRNLYGELWELWYYRLHLAAPIKQLVVPNWNRAESLLFKWYPHELYTRTEKKWWQKNVLELLDRFVSSATLKEHKTLGALYGMTGFAFVSQRVRQHYPFLVEVVEDDF